MSVESNVVFASDWMKNFAPLSQPIVIACTRFAALDANYLCLL